MRRSGSHSLNVEVSSIPARAEDTSSCYINTGHSRYNDYLVMGQNMKMLTGIVAGVIPSHDGL